MSKREKKFLTFSMAIDEILDDFRYDLQQSDLFAKVYSFLVGGKSHPGEEPSSTFGNISEGIWHQPENSKEKIFFSFQDFYDLLIQAFSMRDLSAQDILYLYMLVTGLNAYSGIDSRKIAGIWVATEMEKFQCIQCGHCCLNLSGSYSASVYEEDMVRWRKEGRWDILDYIEIGDLWINPRTGEELSRCPWLRKLPKKDKYICRIHDTKPKHCREYPQSKKHALRTRCKGFT